MFEKRKIRKLVNELVQSSIILSAYPAVELHEDLEEVLGMDTIGMIMEDYFSEFANDPVVLKSIKDSLVLRTSAFVDYIAKMAWDTGFIEYCKDKVCDECGASLYKIGNRYFCKRCYDKNLKETYFEDRRIDGYERLIREGERSDTEEVPVVPEDIGGKKDLDPNVLG